MNKLTDREKLKRAEQLRQEFEKRMQRLLGDDNVGVAITAYNNATLYKAACELEWEQHDGVTDSRGPIVWAMSNNTSSHVVAFCDAKLLEASPTDSEME